MKLKSVITTIAIVLSAIGVSVVTETPASASVNTNVIYVEDHTGWAWPVRSTTTWADYLSVSSVRYGTCRSGYRCIRVYEKTIQSSWAAVTYIDYVSGYTRIYVNPQRNWYSYAKRNSIIHHEMGHAFCLNHVDIKTNLMYPQVGATLYLTAWQKSKFYSCRIGS